MIVLIEKKKLADYTASIYLMAYGVFRFAIEYVRDDYRGASGVAFLTPSQLTAVLLAIFGAALIVLYKYILKSAYARVAEKYDGEAIDVADADAVTEPVEQEKADAENVPAEQVGDE